MTPDSDSPLQASDFDELDAILVDLASRDDAVPPWEFLEGAMAALICTRRPIEASEWMPALLGTGPLPTVPHGDGTHFPSTDRYERFMVLWARREAEVAAMTPEQQGEAMTALVSDRTIIYYQQGHGVYVEYTAADGRLFMWYPRNGGVVRGTWGLRTMDGPNLCYQYRNAVHGVTGEYEPNECISPEQKLIGASVLASRSGDPFGILTHHCLMLTFNHNAD